MCQARAPGLVSPSRALPCQRAAWASLPGQANRGVGISPAARSGKFLRMLESWGRLGRGTSLGGSAGGSKWAGHSLKIFVEMAVKGVCQQN